MSKFNHNMSAISDGARHAELHNAHAASDPCAGAVRREAAADCLCYNFISDMIVLCETCRCSSSSFNSFPDIGYYFR